MSILTTVKKLLWQPPKSTFFYTLHKCASSLFTKEVLPKSSILKHVDYAARLYVGAAAGPQLFEKRGYLYGPIRVTIPNENYPEYRWLIGPCVAKGFLRDKRAIFFVRDPRDILVSVFYSFGFSHGASPLPELAVLQKKRRADISEMGLDAFCVHDSERITEVFGIIQRLISECPQGLVLRYEDLMTDFDQFSPPLVEWLGLPSETVKKMRQQLQPRIEEAPLSHHRSGKPGGFRDKLLPSTVAEMNRILAPALKNFGYVP